jgi:sodium-dependent dicarboxylate transporter 2/3/5
MKQRIHIVAGPLVALLSALSLFYFSEVKTEIVFMISVTIWVAWWWLTEVVPIAVTSLLPLVLLPLLGLAPAKDVARQYMDNIIFLFIGGFILAFALEKWNLHKRIAYIILSRVGTRPSRILLGVMATAYLLSMWISNTATVMMLIAAVMALISEMDEHFTHPKQKRKLAAALLIGLAYAASIGGMATLVGTPTNMIFYREYTSAFPLANDMDFFQWAKMGIPLSLLLALTAYFTLYIMFCRNNNEALVSKHYFKDKLRLLGRWTYEERVVSIVFCVAVVLWFTRSDIELGLFTLHGWSNLLGDHAKYIDDSTVAIVAAIVLFLIPASRKQGPMITWKDAERIPFEIVLLFGGGFALAFGFEVSGLSVWLSGTIGKFQTVHPVLIVFCVSVLICFISEFASNVASIQLMLPVLIAGFGTGHIPPLFFLVPAALSASLGFMLPIATPPNTIVYGTRLITAKELSRAGLVVNLAGIALITAMAALHYSFL